MIKIAQLPTIAGALLAFGLSAAPAQAGSHWTWVSGHGTDGGACPLAAPCRTFAFTLSQTAAGGEIDMLDPADFGAVTITKAVSIVNDGAGVAAIGTTSGNAITINGGAGDVHLRGLTIDGFGSGSNGIAFNTGLNLAIENCVVRNFGGFGIFSSPSTSSSFSVSNTITSNNGHVGIIVRPTGSAFVTEVLSKVTANNNTLSGIVVDGSGTTGVSLNVTIVDSEASNNPNAGVAATSNPGNTAPSVMLRNVVAPYNGFGLEVNGNAILRVAHSVVTGNNTGLSTLGATLFSYVDNDINGNTNDNFGALTPLAMHYRPPGRRASPALRPLRRVRPRRRWPGSGAGADAAFSKP